MCSKVREPDGRGGHTERVLSDCGQCTCPDSARPASHNMVEKTLTDRAGSVVMRWTECSRCGRR